MSDQDEPKPWVSVQEALQRIKENDTGPRRDFLILGAGVAGLAAAIELIALGHKATILEGSDRVGGRVHTRRFANGSYGELGAMRVPGEHDYTYHYIAKAGLMGELRPFPNSHPNGLARIRGQVVQWTDEDFRENVLPLFTELHAHERATLAESGPGGLLGTVMGPLFESLSPTDVRALLAGDFSDPKLRELDQISWHDYLQQRASASEDARELLGAWLGLRMPWQWSMAAILRDELNHTTDRLVEIAGGLDRLPTEMAKLLRPGVIRFHAIVEGIENREGGDGGVVHFRDAQTGAPAAIPFGQLLCTIPFPVLGKLPKGLIGFSAAKLAAIRGLGDDYSTATKILFQYDHRWWEQQPYAIPGGRSMSEQATLQTYYPTPAGESPALARALLQQPAQRRRFALYTGDSMPAAVARSAALDDAGAAEAPGVILASYTYNDLAQSFDGMSEQAASSLVLANLKHLHPSMAPPSETVVWSWDKNPWSGRAFALTRPGTLSKYFADAARAEGSICFAGEHISMAPAWIQGALESSLREVAKMVKWPMG